MKNTFEVRLTDGKIITLETGQLAPQANGAVLATYGKTVVLATAVLGKLDKSKDYFPLSVEFQDKLYAGGLIKGGKWIKREGGPSDNSILFGRIIDRAVRPLFPAGFQNEVQLIVSVLSNDKENDVVIPAFTAASAALMISSIPFNGPVSAVRVGQIDGQNILFPTLAQQQKSLFDLLICHDPEGVNMIEADAKIVDNDTVLSAVKQAMDTASEINGQLVEFSKKYGKNKVEYTSQLPSEELIKEVQALIKQDVEEFLQSGVDGAHIAGEKQIKDKVVAHFETKIESGELAENTVISATDILIRDALRQSTLAGTRYDKRAYDEIRPLNAQVDILPCTHGSALFERGLTQALTITTLGPLSEQQTLQDSTGETNKRYIHYYSAAPFSTGEAGRTGRPGRREIGHGALAEKALWAVVPSVDEFPYTITLTSEVLSQNGSSSMASTCGSTLSLMAAGVPIKDKVAGISVGMMSQGDQYTLLTDIAGIEDHYGDMDFKITGTRNGITAIQLDIKRLGLSYQMIADTFVASTKARLQILDKIESALSTPRPQVSSYAPKIKMITIPVDKIGDIIGSGGKTIKGLMEKYGVEIDVDDFGKVSISAIDGSQVDKAAFEIESMVREVQVGEEFDGTVTRVEDYGAFVEFLPGREALLHVSEMAQGYLSNPRAIVKIGDSIKVRISGFNDNHQIKLSAPEFKQSHAGEARPEGQPQGGFGNRPSFGANRAGFRNFPSRSPRR